MIWSNQEVLLACKLCPKHFTLNCIQMATEDLYCPRIGYQTVKEHVYKLIAKKGVMANIAAKTLLAQNILFKK